ncbi:MAG: DNA helicase II [Chromatiales bacterium]|nr:DNA helicase II [Chromatiales bacterium]
MDVTHILDPLNPAQREAVTAEPGHLLVLAGAGSGKTRVLVHRIAWLLATREAGPWGVLAVTFTNKAAGEMRGRIESILARPVGGMWVGTFHGIAHRLLRQHHQEAGLPDGFQILDADDQLRWVRRVMRDLDVDEARMPPRLVTGFINARKDEGLRPDHVDAAGDHGQDGVLEIWRAYEAACQRSGVVDFAELLLRAHELLRDDPTLLAHYRSRFGHILVDEFQDTNTIQYAWIRLLAGETGLVFAVGDDDQAIYGWRGARVENIQQFSRDFPGVRVIRLEQNYRSTGNILAAANALIAHNAGRLGKDLWTAGSHGDPVQVYSAYNETDEARYVAGRVIHLVEGGDRRDDIAVLYRVSAQSRAFEEALLSAGIPYRVHGGLRFYERAEIKDALAYLRLVANRHDDGAFERVVNVPPRGIGTRTVDILRGTARAEACSLWAAARRVLAAGGLGARAEKAVAAFVDLVDGLADALEGLALEHQVEAMLGTSGLLEHYRNDKSDRAQTRVENLEELAVAAGVFRRGETLLPVELDPAASAEESAEPATGAVDPPRSALAAFLAHAALEAGEEQAGEWDDCVHLMTLHSAKGLEFPVVFLCGLEEGLFPHQRSSDDPNRLEEERRLCYVGMTRARRQLYLTHAESRRLHGAEHFTVASRFLREVPPDLIQEVRMRASVTRPAFQRGGVAEPRPRSRPADDGGGLRLGQRVAHPKFGEGVVLTYEGSGHHTRVQVNFDGAGSKWLVLSVAKLEPL